MRLLATLLLRSSLVIAFLVVCGRYLHVETHILVIAGVIGLINALLYVAARHPQKDGRTVGTSAGLDRTGGGGT